MSNETSHSTARVPIRIGTRLSTRFRQLTVTGVRAVAFWAAVAMPIAYVPALYGVGGFESTWSLLALLAIHIACVVIGHEHNHPSAHEQR